MTERDTFVDIVDGSNKILRNERGQFMKGTSNWCKGLTKHTNDIVNKIALSKTGGNYYNWKGGEIFINGCVYIQQKGHRFVKSHTVWCEHNQMGIVPLGCEIHHIDLNPKNNLIDNLVLLPMDTHKKLHYEIQLKQNPNRIYFGKNINLRGD